MAYLAIHASFAVNGVAAIHSQILVKDVFKDFHEVYPEKFQNKTNGVTPRRWLAFCNPPLRALISDTLGTDAWINELSMLEALRAKADDPKLQSRWNEVKDLAKVKALERIEAVSGVRLPNKTAMLDVQVKRIHEYKRQLLNVLGIVWRYDQIRKMSAAQKKDVVPRICVIGGKAAPGYEMAKRIIKLVGAVAQKINNDPAIGDLLKVVFVPVCGLVWHGGGWELRACLAVVEMACDEFIVSSLNIYLLLQDYNVSLAEIIIPGTDLSEHISTAGTEASGTGNMKFQAS